MSHDSPLIFDIAKGSSVDGPGVRSVVFFKGCPLHCLWCQNPESQNPNTEIFYSPEDCIECGNCREGKKCYTGARKKIGKYYPPPELIKIIMQDKAYYEISGGGVTFSGGEPFLFHKYLGQVLPELKNKKVNTAVQTSGYFDHQVFNSGLFKFIDTIFYDLKVLDSEKHREYTGVSNDLIINNFLKLLEVDVELVPRVPLIPEYTATEKNLTQISDFLKTYNISKCQLLPYNTAGLDKWKKLGKEVPAGISRTPMSVKEEKYWHKIFINS